MIKKPGFAAFCSEDLEGHMGFIALVIYPKSQCEEFCPNCRNSQYISVLYNVQYRRLEAGAEEKSALHWNEGILNEVH